MAEKLTLYGVLEQDDPAMMNDIIERAVQAFNARLAGYFNENIRGILLGKERAGTLGGAFTTLYGKDAMEQEMSRDEAVDKIARAVEFMLIDWMELSLQRFIDETYETAEQNS
jgi:hypothetical protein